ncbi:unnamed protein product [marine sediment metagenome]|uniref:Uncharacterized protein n=1 Tax=marine sediment metagenome TaxID=412755 RepID=X0UFR0_9ZZZZ
MKSIYLEDQSLPDLIKTAGRNLRDMTPQWKVQVTDRVLEIVEERLSEEVNHGNHDGRGDLVTDKS